MYLKALAFRLVKIFFSLKVMSRRHVIIRTRSFVKKKTQNGQYETEKYIIRDWI